MSDHVFIGCMLAACVVILLIGLHLLRDMAKSDKAEYERIMWRNNR